MPVKKYSHKENRPTYKKKSDALRHGYIQYGKTKNHRNFIVYRVKGGWNVIRKK
jgi:hypothetical protein